MEPQDTSSDELLRRRLREARLKAGLKQIELAQALGEPQSFVSKYESGERRLTFLEVRTICGVLGLRFVDFVQQLEEDLK
ncbi:MAG TPA: helix-turn-helix transcriptional regulator [Thermoanaerobaculia bacterium]|nr:helix-turn-helix transcriptional regulator [Thermoanaerobaculia bacterium]